MKEIFNILSIVVIIIAVPIIGSIVDGFDKKISSRLQGRKGHTLFQPLYNMIGFLKRARKPVNGTQEVFLLFYLIFNACAAVIFFMGSDLLICALLLMCANIMLILGALNVSSPYSKIGGQREIIQLASYAPVLLFVCVGIYSINKSFMVSKVFDSNVPVIYDIPLLFAGYIFVMAVKLRKSPFDFSTSWFHGNQEIINGTINEYTGKNLAILEIAKWYETVLLFGILAMFFSSYIILGIVCSILVFIALIFVNESTARYRWEKTLFWASILGPVIGIVSIASLYIKVENF